MSSSIFEWQLACYLHSFAGFQRRQYMTIHGTKYILAFFYITLHIITPSSKYMTTYLFSCDQAALWMVQSVCPSVRHTFLTMFSSSHHHEIFRSYCQWEKWCPCKRSKVKVTEVMTQLTRFPDRKSSSNLHIYDDGMMYKAWRCLGEVPYGFSRSTVKFQGQTDKKIVNFEPNWAFPDCNSSLNSSMTTKWWTKLEVA